MKQTKKKATKMSMRFKLVTLPLILLFIAILGIGSISSYSTRKSLIHQMKNDGLEIVSQIAKQIEQNNTSLQVITEKIDSDIKQVGQFVRSNQNQLSPALLKQFSKDLEIDEINVFDKNGEILYSNLDENVGFIAPKDHVLFTFLNNQKDFLSEESRKSTVSENYYKYGYVKNLNGGAIQIGVLANKLQALTEKFDYQTLVENLVQNKNIVYALFIDKNLKAVAHSNKNRIGIDLTDTGSKTAAVDGKPYSSEFFYEGEKVNVYDILYPVVINGKHVGAINVGLSMKDVYASVKQNILLVSAVGILFFILIGSVLFLMSNNIVKLLNSLKIHLNFIADGDFTKDISKKELNRKDELGEMANALVCMENSVKKIIQNITEKSTQTTTNSDSLASISEEMSASSQELAMTMSQVADGATNQSQDLKDSVDSLSELKNNIENIDLELQNVKKETENAANKATIGEQEMNTLVKSIDEMKQAFELVVGKVKTLTHSIHEISGITEIICTISEQTNLLALNAAIEAARAGEHGKGFSVVAEEVRKLAEESKQFTEKIINLVSSITKDTNEMIYTSKNATQSVEEQTTSLEKTLKAFKDILVSVENIVPFMDKTHHAMHKIIQSKDTLMEKVSKVSSLTEENSAGIQQVSASSQELSASSEEVASTAQTLNEIAMHLMHTIECFKIS
ncbi:methyl-accepting chemotaxis protein [Marinisporobacter balticus]|uniref:Methyl-accepting chemotaxis protein n=1 Tax=Marinisporobacter balticus TaxID=2018667 RepID=A0A4R2KVA0_9FIRM|nr:methyl-accepting chemotaxis protein [Marinisporobacter balticus]TCO76852.1 methyl-accepting chemotaxis protein [Marinisporobacter balticus]